MTAPNTPGAAGSSSSPASAASSASAGRSRHDVGGDYLRSVKAQQVQPGDRFLTRRGEPSAPVTQTRITRDDFGTPALVIATLADDRQVRIAFGSTIRVRTHRPAPALDTAADLAPVQEGSPEAVVVEIAQRHPEDQRLLALAAKLSRGINMRSGAQLEDIDTMARYLFVDLDDSDGALRATTLLTSLPFDGAMGRWKSIESALALAANIHHHRGEKDEAVATGARLREPDEAEPDPIRAPAAGGVPPAPAQRAEPLRPGDPARRERRRPRGRAWVARVAAVHAVLPAGPRRVRDLHGRGTGPPGPARGRGPAGARGPAGRGRPDA